MLYLLLFLVKIAPAFVNHYYDECLSQHLAPVCTRLMVPTWEVFLYYLTKGL